MLIERKSFSVNLIIFSAILFTILNLNLPVRAQFDVGDNDTINPGLYLTLTAIYEDMGIPVEIAASGVSGPLPIGFEFSFFGNLYSQFYIGANGWISFSSNQDAIGTQEAFMVPNSSASNPKNCILGPFQALNPETTGSPYIFYVTAENHPIRNLLSCGAKHLCTNVTHQM
ncbi:MAG: hypothetical protein IPF68_11765 [Bacteroidales bacterium]|nr:hypothetical protein [Bacteroidales bacterium]